MMASRLSVPLDPMLAVAAELQPTMQSCAYPGQRAVPCWFMRGGSSRGGVFLAEDLPADPLERAGLLLGIYGSPDLRQIDGIGGADPLTSKAAVIARSERPDADIDYTFYQVGIARPRVSTGGNCGNMLSAAAAFAVLRGLVPITQPSTALRIFTTNTGQVVKANVPVLGDMPAVDGSCEIAGVPGCGAPIELDFGDCAGAVSGALLPTGSPVDRIDVGGHDIEVSLVDASTPFVFVRAADLGAVGTELPDAINADEALQSKMEKVRGWAAVVLSLSPTADDAHAVSPNVPRVMMVSPPQEHVDLSGRTAASLDHDICVRQMAMQRPHRALAVTGSVCTAVAAAIEGTVVNRSATIGSAVEFRLAHPSGVLRVASEVECGPDGSYVVRSARIERTARLILQGTVYVPECRIAALTKSAEI